jgi:hypothetical protein
VSGYQVECGVAEIRHPEQVDYRGDVSVHDGKEDHDEIVHVMV